MTAKTLLTIEDFEALPDEVAKNHELVDGELVDVSGNNPLHNHSRDNLITILLPWVRERNLGMVIAEQEYDFLGNAHGPDVTFFGPEKLRLLDRRKRVQRFVPDLAIEIAGISNTYEELLQKKNRYLKAGTQEVWIMSPESREIAIYSKSGNRILTGADRLTTELLPGFSMTVDQLFGEA
jgi:Uma2 family endonuclease